VRSAPIYLDSVVFIDALEGESEVSDAAQILLRWLRDRSRHAFTSELALAECLAPRRRTGEGAIGAGNNEALSALLASTDLVELVPITRPILLATCEVRRGRSMKLPDAIHFATAAAAGCDLFVTRDLDFRSDLRLTVLSPLHPDLPRRLDMCLA
jgi:predicted nucleic acid-binding protein